jgi:allantoinase
MMLKVMERVTRTGLVHAVQAEDAQILAHATAELRQQNKNGPAAHPLSRPLIAEEASVGQMIPMAKALHSRLHIVHCSSPTAIKMATQAREDGVQMTVEVCFPYLFFSDTAYSQHGPYAKTNPPLRSETVREALWAQVKSGAVDVLATDHSPFLVSEKEPFLDNIWGAHPGAPGLEAFLPLCLTAVNHGYLSLAQMVRLTSENAARLYGFYPAKGAVRIGSDADLVIVDLSRKHNMNPESWHTKSRGTARMYSGYRCQVLLWSRWSQGRWL